MYNYMKYSEEEQQARREADLAEARYLVEHWDEIVAQQEEESRLRDEEFEKFKEKWKKRIFFWKKFS